MEYLTRKTLLYKTGVEYGDFTINHVQGCAHGCLYPCYAMMMAKRCGRVKSYEEWLKPKIVKNSKELLKTELNKYKDQIKFVHLCFSTDPFMFGQDEISELSIDLIRIINDSGIKCTTLTKGIMPIELCGLSKKNEYGITLISLDEKYREKLEPYSAPYDKRIASLLELHRKGLKTWVSIEPYPTPNIIEQNFMDILDSISFVDKIIFGKLNYNKKVSEYKNNKLFFNELSSKVMDFCKNRKKEYHIKSGTISENTNKNINIQRLDNAYFY